MVHIIAITNQKGGVGKTTTTLNVAASLAAIKRRTLLVDMDPQGNATSGAGLDKAACAWTVNEVLLGQATAAQVCQTCNAGFAVLPANHRLTVAEVQLLAQTRREMRLRDALADCLTQYDYVLIDCPPTLNILTINALVAAQSVIIPVQCEYYALEGLTGLLKTIGQLSQQVNPDLRIGGVLRTMYDGRNRLAVDVSAQLVAHFSEQVFQTIIPRNVRLAEAPSHGVPVLHYDCHSQGAIAYLALAGELTRRLEHACPEYAGNRQE